MNLEYEPAQFQDMYELYPETWDIVSSPASCMLMRDMAKLGFAVIDAMHHVSDFCRLDAMVKREVTKEQYNRFHQMIGHMCLQIMEHLGYVLVENNKRVKLSVIFRTGAMYQWHEEIDSS